jgi:Protein of unknown function (DUF1571)
MSFFRPVILSFALVALWLTAWGTASADKERREARRSAKAKQGSNADDRAETGTDLKDESKTPAEPGQKSAEGDLPALTLPDVIRFAKESRPAVKEVKDFTALFTKIESVNGRMISQVMEMKFRAKPFSVYMIFKTGDSQGRQVLYFEGKNNNNLVVKETGFKSIVGAIPLRLNDSKVMAENRHPITQIGIANLLETTITDWEHDAKVEGDDVEVQFFPNARLDGVPCQAVQVKHNRKLSELKYHMNRIYFDKETKLPLRGERFGWPKQPGEKPPLLEDYKYSSLKTDVHLTDADFDPVRYGF